jgi:hypothetical protein
MRGAGNGRSVSAQPIAAPASSRAASAAHVNGGGHGRTLSDALRDFRAVYGNAWSFDILRHARHGDQIEVVGQLQANGTTARETAAATLPIGGSLGTLLEQTANDSLRKCIETLMRKAT